jgi:2-methylcitrate dehydratase PrpD
MAYIRAKLSRKDTPMDTISAQIAGWVRRTRIAELPPTIVQQTKLRALDLTGVMLAAKDLKTVRTAREASAATDGGGSAMAVGSKLPTSLTNAAFINGIQASAMEFDDTYLPTTMHATGLAISVCYPESQFRKISGARLIESVLLASEIMIRLSIVTERNWFDYGIHPTGSFGPFGGVCALSKLRGLENLAIVHALGHAGSMSTALTAAFEDGTSTKNLHVGLAAANAFRAVALAEAGISGPTAVFEGKFGWYRSHIQDDDKRFYERVTTELGHEWLAESIATKLYPVANPLMPHIEATITLRNKYQIKPEEVESIDAYIKERSFLTLCNPPELKRHPLTTWHGRISIYHTIAEALVNGKMDKYAYSEEAIHNPVINALADKVTPHVDHEATDLTRQRGKVVIHLKDGRSVEHFIPDFRGTRRNPITTDDYIGKFRSNVGDILPAATVDKVIDAFLGLEKVDDIAPILKLLDN